MAGGKHYSVRQIRKKISVAGENIQISHIFKKGVYSKVKETRNKISVRQYAFIVGELTSRELKRKYARSSLGILWSIFNPLLYMSVMTLVFAGLFRSSIDKYPVYILTAYIMFDFFTKASEASLTVLVDNRDMLMKIKYPRQVLVLSRVFTALVNFGYMLLPYVLMLFLFHVQIRWTAVFFLADVFFELLFSAGISYFLAVEYVFFRDVKFLHKQFIYFWVHMIAMYYPLDRLSGTVRLIVENNPWYLFIKAARECIMYGQIPEKGTMASVACWGIGVFLAGYLYFMKKDNDVMQKI